MGATAAHMETVRLSRLTSRHPSVRVKLHTAQNDAAAVWNGSRRSRKRRAIRRQREDVHTAAGPRSAPPGHRASPPLLLGQQGWARASPAIRMASGTATASTTTG